jgi:hypothetical protein
VAAIDTAAPHLFECGFTSSQQFVVSGQGFSGTSPATSTAAAGNMFLFSFDGVLGVPVSSVGEVVVSRSEPSAQTKQSMRAYFLAKYGSI